MNQQVNNRKVNTFKTIYLLVLCLITIAAICFGTFVHTGTGFNFGFNFGKHITKEWKEADLSSTCNGLDINMNVGEVIIMADGKSSISFEGKKAMAPTVNVSNGIWTLRQKTKNKAIGSVFTGRGRLCRVKVHLPSDTDLNSLRLTCKAGDITLRDLHAKSMDLSVSAGDLDLTGSTVGQLTAKLSMGDFDIKDSSIQTVETTLSMGDLEAKNVEIGNFSADMSMGDITLKSKTDLSKATMDLRTSMGDVSVNKEKQGSKYHVTSDPSDHILDIKNSMGDIDILW